MNRKAMTVAIALAGLLAVGACTNPETPAGHEGYVYYKPLIWGKMEYREALKGPSSTGVSWRLYVTNVDMRVKSYAEQFRLLSGDNLSVAFEANARIRLRPNSVRMIVEEWGADKWYDFNVREPLRTVVRQAVTEVSAVQIQLETDEVRQIIFDRLVEKYNDTPIEILSVDIGNIEFPPEVTEAIERKIAKQQELERQEFLLAKTRKEAAIRVLESLKVAKQQKIISSTLDPLYVQRRAVQVYRKLAESTNKTIIMLPNTSDGTAMPLVLSVGRRKILSAADEKLLADMEERYMKVARTPVEPTDLPNPILKPDPEVGTDGADNPESPDDADGATPAPTEPAPAPIIPNDDTAAPSTP